MRGRRPAGIWIIVALQMALAITLLPGFAERFPGASPISGMSLDTLWQQIYLGWAVVNVLSALWLWTLSRRGWALTMVLVGIGLSANLIMWFNGEPNFVRMAIQAATALYLNSAPVREIFLREHDVSRIELPENGST
ncbi:MAG TPA: hypothetical protein VEX62_06885 [Candidatus Limnocylindrales bacterium]|jgi:hypothetical protein|nr:hypothetical protein [Candidatus Limnocylindrales bacterium]